MSRTSLRSSKWGEASQPCDSSFTTSLATSTDGSSVHSAENSDSDDSLESLVQIFTGGLGYFRENNTSPPGTPRPDSPILGVLPPPLTMATQPVNDLLSTQKSSDGLQIALHPLPLLEISDHITRSYQRGYKGAIVGALLGQQNGRQITIEYSFTIGAIKGEDGRYRTDPESFIARLDQSKLPVAPTFEPNFC
jgi:COP9 signalosome complex subunit 6